MGLDLKTSFERRLMIEKTAHVLNIVNLLLNLILAVGGFIALISIGLSNKGLEFLIGVAFGCPVLAFILFFIDFLVIQFLFGKLHDFTYIESCNLQLIKSSKNISETINDIKDSKDEVSNKTSQTKVIKSRVISSSIKENKENDNKTFVENESKKLTSSEKKELINKYRELMVTNKISIKKYLDIVDNIKKDKIKTFQE